MNTKKYHFFIIRNEKVDSSIPFIGTSKINKVNPHTAQRTHIYVSGDVI